MKELFEQNKVLFLAVITALIIVFLVKKLIDYITKKGLEGIRLDVYKLFVEAEKTFRASKQGQQKFDYAQTYSIICKREHVKRSCATVV